MGASSDESSYSAESMCSFDNQVWEHFAGRSEVSLALSVYREKLLADDQMTNRAITICLDQRRSVLVGRDTHDGCRPLDLFRLVLGCWNQLCRSPLYLSRCDLQFLYLLVIWIFLQGAGFLEHWLLSLR